MALVLYCPSLWVKKMKQTNLFEYFDKKDVRKRFGRTQHGGAKTRGHRKLERPLSTKNWIHLILKSDKAKGPLSFLLPRNKQIIQLILREKSKKFGVTLVDGANVGNHLHLKIKIQNRESFQKFLKSVTCLIARKVTGARRGKKFGRFWQGLAFTRVLTSSLEELNLKGYISKPIAFKRTGVRKLAKDRKRNFCVARIHYYCLEHKRTGIYSL